ncbi:MAG: hypothetical protein HYX96_08500 [Chloroflexi bacterium]|nr:hypothetical protein [Chloroflexota bacterium]
MRDFNEADKKKKRARIQIPDNPAGLPAEVLAHLEKSIKASLKDGNLPCARAFTIARDAGVPRIAIGDRTDKLGLRVINCQIGCFKVDKTLHNDLEPGGVDDGLAGALKTLADSGDLTCSRVFDLAQRTKQPPMAVADAANRLKMKIHSCQLGCF